MISNIKHASIISIGIIRVKTDDLKAAPLIQIVYYLMVNICVLGASTLAHIYTIVYT